MYDVVVKRSRLLSHLLMSSCSYDAGLSRNRPESKMRRIFRPVRRVTTPVGQQTINVVWSRSLRIYDAIVDLSLFMSKQMLKLTYRLYILYCLPVKQTGLFN